MFQQLIWYKKFSRKIHPFYSFYGHNSFCFFRKLLIVYCSSLRAILSEQSRRYAPCVARVYILKIVQIALDRGIIINARAVRKCQKVSKQKTNVRRKLFCVMFNTSAAPAIGKNVRTSYSNTYVTEIIHRYLPLITANGVHVACTRPYQGSNH